MVRRKYTKREDVFFGAFWVSIPIMISSTLICTICGVGNAYLIALVWFFVVIILFNNSKFTKWLQKEPK